MSDILIIGGGVVGGLIARELSKYKVSVTIVEKENDVARGSSCANTGIVHAGFDAKPGTLKAKLNVLGNKMMPKLAKTLGVKYKNNGSLVLAFSEDEMKTVKELYDRGVENGVPDLKILSHDEVLSMEPNVSSDVAGALFAPTGGIICPYSLTIASIGCAMDNGTKLYTNFKVTKIKKNSKGNYAVYSEDKRKIEAKIVVNCAGMFSDEIAGFAGKCDFKVSPRSGEYMLLDKEVGDYVKMSVFQVPTKMGKGILVTPTADGNLLLGPTSTDITDKYDKRTSRNGLDTVLAGVQKSVKSVPMRSVITSFTGLRSVGSTGDFIINMNDNFVNCAGIESPGLTSSPAIALYVVDMIKNSGFNLAEKKAWRPGRKHVRPSKEKYNHIICRCETISEGEILEAIHTNPGAKDIDGVKKRTRAGMGRCQGGFCQPFVAEIIARELNIPLDKVTKSGEGSNLLFGDVKEDF